MNISRQSTSLLFCFLIGTLLIGCKEKESILIENNICQYPCWQNIIPGKTSSDEAIRILLKLPFMDSKPLNLPVIVNNETSYNSWTFQKDILEMGGRITFYNNTTAYFEFVYIAKIHINKLFEYYGKPNYVTVISGFNDSRWLRVSWIYPAKGVFITHFDDSWQTQDTYAKITSDLLVNQVYYFDPNLYDYLLEDVFYSPADLSTIEQRIQIWNDYGKYSYTEIK